MRCEPDHQFQPEEFVFFFFMCSNTKTVLSEGAPFILHIVNKANFHQRKTPFIIHNAVPTKTIEREREHLVAKIVERPSPERLLKRFHDPASSVSAAHLPS